MFCIYHIILRMLSVEPTKPSYLLSTSNLKKWSDRHARRREIFHDALNIIIVCRLWYQNVLRLLHLFVRLAKCKAISHSSTEIGGGGRRPLPDRPGHTKMLREIVRRRTNYYFFDVSLCSVRILFRADILENASIIPPDADGEFFSPAHGILRV